MANFLPAFPLAELPAAGFKSVELMGKAVLIGRVEGQLFACLDRCPHAGVPLRLGRLRGEELTCQRHGWVFNVLSGKSVPDDPAFCLSMLEVTIDGDQVLVGVNLDPPSDSAHPS